MMTREEGVAWLINDDIEYIHAQMWDGDTEYLRDILVGNGFTQYRYLSTQLLLEEVETREELKND